MEKEEDEDKYDDIQKEEEDIRKKEDRDEDLEKEEEEDQDKEEEKDRDNGNRRINNLTRKSFVYTHRLYPLSNHQILE